MKLIYYYIIGLAAIVVILFSLIRRRRKRKLTQEINYESESKNIARSITNCKRLHKDLVKMVHPDKFNDTNRVQADRLMQLVNAARYDYARLVALKAEVQSFLNNKI